MIQKNFSKKARCQDCKEWILSRTLSSMDIPLYHCRHGFTPSSDCQDMAEYNNNIRRSFYREYPEYLQFHFNFSLI